MKYSLRFVWYVLRIVIVAVSAFAILIVAFFIAKDSANVFVIVSDGMKARAENILITSSPNSLEQYFSAKFITDHAGEKAAGYENFTITDIKYKLSVESLWCNPWRNTATVTAVESIPEMAYSGDQTDTATDKKAAEPPAWPRARYRIQCLRIGDAWRIDSIEKIEDMAPEPTASPEPSKYITASPLPTSTPTASPTGSPSPSPTPTKAK